MDEESGIYRDEVRLMMITLADISVDTRDILALLRGLDEEENDEAEDDT